MWLLAKLRPAGYLVHRVPSPGRVPSIARPGTGALSMGKSGKGQVPKEGPLTSVPRGWSPGNDALSLRKVPAALHPVKCPGHNVLSPGKVPATQHPGDSPWDVMPDILQGVWCIVPRPRGRFPVPCTLERCWMPHPWGRTTELGAERPSESLALHTLSSGTVPSALHPWRRSSGRDARHPSGSPAIVPRPWGRFPVFCIPGEGPRYTMPNTPRDTRCIPPHPWGCAPHPGQLDRKSVV